MEMTKKVKVNTKDCVIKGVNTKTGEEEWFLNVVSAVKAIGCTRAQVYNVLNKVGYCKTAKGWHLEWVDFNDVVLKPKKTKKTKKPNFEVQVHEDGDQISEAEYWQQVENMIKNEGVQHE